MKKTILIACVSIIALGCSKNENSGGLGLLNQTGELLTQIKEVSNNGNVGQTWFFKQNGTQYDRSVHFNGTLLSDFDYDTAGRLAMVTRRDPNGVISETYSFEYENNQIRRIIKTRDGFVRTTEIVFDGNIILTYDGSEPPGSFKNRYTFEDSSYSKLVKNESNSPSSTGGSWLLYISEYEYYTSGNNLFTIETREDSGDPILENDRYYEIDPMVRNPVYLASQNLYLQYHLMPAAFRDSWGVQGGQFNENFISYHVHAYWANDYSIRMFPEIIQGNNLPAKVGVNEEGFGYSFEFYYE